MPCVGCTACGRQNVVAQRTSQARMQCAMETRSGRTQGHLLRLIGTALDHLDPADKCLACIVGQHKGFLVRYPAVNTAPTRIYPDDMLKAKVFT